MTSISLVPAVIAIFCGIGSLAAIMFMFEGNEARGLIFIIGLLAIGLFIAAFTN